MNFRLYDAHNHLQDDRLAPHREAILAALQREGVAGMVVNGSCEEDWPEVLELARLFHSGVAADGSRRNPSEPKIAPTDRRRLRISRRANAQHETSGPVRSYPS